MVVLVERSTLYLFALAIFRINLVVYMYLQSKNILIRNEDRR
jgi:hypothetical protein